ncbi:MAG: RluA family pseudouridine synthase [Actinomycetota bacterium]|nr:RluA family pseudouridine synthase [Actinomycetota bacterium]
MSERLEIPQELDGERVDRSIAILCGVSRRIAKSTIESGGVVRDGSNLSPADRVAAGDAIDVDLVADETPVVADVDVEFAIAFEDDDVVVVDKPAGVVVHPGAGRSGGTLANGLLARIPEIAQLGPEHRWGIVHRIDRDTSGLLIVAKTPAAFENLQAALKKRAVNRRYLTLVSGRFTNTNGTIDAPVGRDHAHPTRMTVTEGGRPARTHYRRLADWEDHDESLLAVTLETGRTHQIRVHMRAIDHPIIGDSVYGPGRKMPGDPGRTWLHAEALTFEHPSGSGPLTVHAELPADLVGSLSEVGPPTRGAVE